MADPVTDLPSLVERIAREADFNVMDGRVFDDEGYGCITDRLTRFAQAIAADIAEQVGGNNILSGSPDWAFSWGWSSANEAAANLIRERYGLERTASKPVVECEPPGPLVWEDDQNEQQRTE